MTKKCIICKSEFYARPYRMAKARFCSPKCHGISMKGHIPWNKGLSGIHLSVGTEFKKGIIPWSKGTRGVLKANSGSFKKGHHLSPSGSKHWLWKGGITPINKALRKSNDYKLWRKNIFERDKYTCQECGIRGGELHPHHLKPWAMFPTLRFDTDNGITLCVSCHKKTDTWGINFTKKFGSVVAVNN